MEAITLSKRLQKTVSEMQEDLKKWKIEIAFETDPETFGIKVLASRPARAGHVAISLTKEAIQYYRDDQNSLVDTVCETIFEQLIRELLISEISDDLKRVINNTLSVADRTK
jgi:hypothetical protein